MKKILYIFIALGVCGGAIGYTMFNKTLPSTIKQSTDLKIESSSLLDAFENDENEANKKFLDKVMEVSGTVGKIEKMEGKISIYLSTGNELSNIICQLESDIMPKLKEGDKTIIKGICTGYLMDVVLVRSVIIKS